MAVFDNLVESGQKGLENYNMFMDELSGSDTYRLAYMSNGEFQGEVANLTSFKATLQSYKSYIAKPSETTREIRGNDLQKARLNSAEGAIRVLGLSGVTAEQVLSDKQTQKQVVSGLDSLIANVDAAIKQAGNVRWSYFQYGGDIADEKAAEKFLYNYKDMLKGDLLEKHMNSLLVNSARGDPTSRKEYDDMVRCAVLLRGKMYDSYKILDKWDLAGIWLSDGQKVADRVIKFNYNNNTDKSLFGGRYTRQGYANSFRNILDKLDVMAGNKSMYLKDGVDFANSGMTVRQLALSAQKVDANIWYNMLVLRGRVRDPNGLVDAVESGDTRRAEEMLKFTQGDRNDSIAKLNEVMRLRGEAQKLSGVVSTLKQPQEYMEFLRNYIGLGQMGDVPSEWEPNFDAAKAQVIAYFGANEKPSSVEFRQAAAALGTDSGIVNEAWQAVQRANEERARNQLAAGTAG